MSDSDNIFEDLDSIFGNLCENALLSETFNDETSNKTLLTSDLTINNGKISTSLLCNPVPLIPNVTVETDKSTLSFKNLSDTVHRKRERSSLSDSSITVQSKTKFDINQNKKASTLNDATKKQKLSLSDSAITVKNKILENHSNVTDKDDASSEDISLSSMSPLSVTSFSSSSPERYTNGEITPPPITKLPLSFSNDSENSGSEAQQNNLLLQSISVKYTSEFQKLQQPQQQQQPVLLYPQQLLVLQPQQNLLQIQQQKQQQQLLQQLLLQQEKLQKNQKSSKQQKLLPKQQQQEQIGENSSNIIGNIISTNNEQLNSFNDKNIGSSLLIINNNNNYIDTNKNNLLKYHNDKKERSPVKSLSPVLPKLPLANEKNQEMNVDDNNSNGINSSNNINSNNFLINGDLKNILRNSTTDILNYASSNDIINDKMLKKKWRMIKNRQSAIASRLKRTEHVMHLESKICEISHENDKLKTENFDLRHQLNYFLTNCQCYLLKQKDKEKNSKPILEQQNSDKLINSEKLIKYKNNSNIRKNTIVLLSMFVIFSFNIGNFRNTLSPISIQSINNINDGTKEKDQIFMKKGLLHNNIDDNNEITDSIFTNRFNRRLLWMIENQNITINENNDNFYDSITENIPINSTITMTNCPTFYVNQTENMRLADELKKWIEFNDYINITEHNDHDTNTSTFIGPKFLSSNEHLKYRYNRNKTNNNNIGLNSINRRKRKNHLKSLSDEMNMMKKEYNVFNTIVDNNDQNQNNDNAVNHNDHKYMKLIKKINRKDDTFYVLSLSNSDHILLPASAYNKTSRPKIALMFPATNENLFNSNDNTKDKMILMQIDCEVMNTTMLEFYNKNHKNEHNITSKNNNKNNNYHHNKKLSNLTNLFGRQINYTGTSIKMVRSIQQQQQQQHHHYYKNKSTHESFSSNLNSNNDNNNNNNNNNNLIDEKLPSIIGLFKRSSLLSSLSSSSSSNPDTGKILFRPPPSYISNNRFLV